MSSFPAHATSEAADSTRSELMAPFSSVPDIPSVPAFPRAPEPQSFHNEAPSCPIPHCAIPHPDLILASELKIRSEGGPNISTHPVDRLIELEEQLAQRERQIAAMHRASQALFAHVSVDDMVRETLSIALDVTGGEAGSVQLYEADRESLIFRYVVGMGSEGLEGRAIPVSEGIGGRVFQSGIPDLTHSVYTSEAFNRSVDEATGFHTHSLMTVPVKGHDEHLVGVMQVAHTQQNFDERDLEVLSVLCDTAASAIAQARLQHAARQVQLISLLGDISHDIKNMLTPLGTGASTLRWLLDESFKRIDQVQEDDNPKRALNSIMNVLHVVRGEYSWILSNAEDGAERVQARTREIADAIKGEISPPYFECAPLSSTVDEVMHSLTPVAHKAKVRLLTALAREMPSVEHDRKMLYNALYNLVNNALAATQAGDAITVRAWAEDESTVCIRVEDTGCGIPEHVRVRLFTEYAISTKPGGTGLGTRIVAGVVKRHNGTISVESEEGRGSTFTIKFPLVRCDE